MNIRNFALFSIPFLLSAAFAAPPEFDHTHASWKAIVSETVKTEGSVSEVDYAKIKRAPQALDGYLSTLSAVPSEAYEKFSTDEKLTFLINAYNAFTVKLIIEHYPVRSIKKIGGAFSSPWKVKFFKLLGKERYLDELEHEIIRKQFNEPRIHLALVCASKGCPALRAYDAKKLNEELDHTTNVFLRDPQRNRYDPASKKLELGKIFDWYGEDFVKKHG